jgi:hypothetical protein
MTPEQCRVQGAMCLKLAKFVKNDGDKMLLLNLAEAWRVLAERKELQPTDDYGRHR